MWTDTIHLHVYIWIYIWRPAVTMPSRVRFTYLLNDFKAPSSQMSLVLGKTTTRVTILRRQLGNTTRQAQAVEVWTVEKVQART